MPTPERIFLGWNRPPIASAAGAIVERFASRHAVLGTVDLRDVVVVVPGSRAGRLLLGALVACSGGALLPPRVVTPRVMAGLLLPDRMEERRAATEAMAWASWVHGWRGLTPRDRGVLAGTDDAERGWSIGARLDRTRETLWGGLKRVAEVARLAREHDLPDTARWDAFERLEALRLEALAEVGRFDPREAWTEILRGPGPLPAPSDGGTTRLVLAGVAELNAPAREALRRTPASVAAMVLAPEGEGWRFDEFGCVAETRWIDARPPIEDAAIHVAPTLVDECEAVLASLREFGEAHAAAEVIVSAPDRSLASLLVRHGTRVGVAFHDSVGSPALATPPGRLLTLVADLLEHGAFEAWGQVLRHPDVERAVAKRLGAVGGKAHEFWLGAVDEFARTALPRGVEDLNRAPVVVREVRDALAGVLGPLSAREAGDRRPIAAWCSIVGAWIASLLPDSDGEGARGRTGEGLEAIGQVLRELGSLAGVPGLDGPVSAWAALRIIASRLERRTIADEPEGMKGLASVELLGWLEVALDDAPAAILTGFSEETLPGRASPDPLLPPGLASRAGLAEGATRPARDAYLLTLISHTKRRVVVTASRRDGRGDVRLPSRLLFLCDRASLVARARMWTEEATTAVPTAWNGASRLPVMPRAEVEIPRVLPVTAFRDYLRSPYLFYLKHVLKLEEEGEAGLELDAREFGTLLHEVVAEVSGDGRLRGSSNAEEVFRGYEASLESRLARTYGDSVPPAVWVQGEQARGRLRALAEWQAGRVEAGWRVREVEWSPAHGAIDWVVDGTPIRLSGRIDRVEVNERTGEVALLDFKTNEKPADPEKTHRRQGEWIDLQLPLYSLLAGDVLGVLRDEWAREPVVKLGFVAIPADARVETKHVAWSPDDLETALETAREVIRKIRRGKFFELGDDPPTEGVFGALAGASLPREGNEARGDEAAGEGEAA